ncbi:MAG TPA: sigma-70 family RNA polymerase sigma factor [Deltaproteobacteria bacterium]|nr:sigma-70 family RNA polymerase sigma factor [Deltaproteobacteria bacterium]
MSSQPSDAELVRRFKDGDREAYAEIVRRYQDRVFTLCLRWMGDREVAEEVAQDVFLALYRSLVRFRGDAQLSTWVYRVVINHCKNRRLYRRRRHMDRHEALDGEPRDADEAPGRQLADEGPGTDAPLHAREAGELLQRALAQLDEEQRHIVVLRDVQDLSYEEISDILELPRGTVKSRLHRARSQLAAVLSRRISREDVV